MLRKIFASLFLFLTITTLSVAPYAAEQVHADAVSSVLGGLGGGLAGAGAGGALGAGVGRLIGGPGSDGALIGGLIGAGVGAIAGAVAGATGNLAGGIPGLNFGQLSSYGIHVPQGTVLQANNPQLEPLIVQIINFFLGFVALIAFLMLLYGGFRYLASAGDPEATKKGKQTIAYAVIGVVVIAVSYAATNTLIAGIGPQVSSNFSGLGFERSFPGFPGGGSNLGFAIGLRL